MSSCSGPDCTDKSHFDDKGNRIGPVVKEKKTITIQSTRKPLTRNQLKARRRAGVPGY